MGKFYRSNYNSKPKGRKSPPPYNFIEPNKRVFYPQDCGEISDSAISFEKPFSDAQSGVLEIVITAKSDIFTGAFTLKNADTQTPKEFFKIGNYYALSGSSVRGVIRTIAEVLSFAKFHTDAPDYKDKKGEIIKRFKSNFAKNESKLDMVERIFGVVSQSTKVQALKSRISFSHFIASEVCKPLYTNPKYTLLDAIKEAKKKDRVPKFCKENGFRFYAPLKSIGKPLAPDKTGDTISTISPLGKGSVFVGKLRYFNLTKAEFGLILLCLSALRDDKGECYKFGGAKFYGYGDARVEIFGIDEGAKNECINTYKNLLSKNGFEVETRLNILRAVSKIQDSAPLNFKPHNYSKHKFDKQDNDDDIWGL